MKVNLFDYLDYALRIAEMVKKDVERCIDLAIEGRGGGGYILALIQTSDQTYP